MSHFNYFDSDMVRHGRVTAHGGTLLAWVQCENAGGNADQGSKVVRCDQMLDLDTGVTRQVWFRLHENWYVADLAFSMDGKQLAVTISNGRILVVKVDRIVGPRRTYTRFRSRGENFGVRYGRMSFLPNHPDHGLFGSVLMRDRESDGYSFIQLNFQAETFTPCRRGRGSSDKLWKLLTNDE